jgi:predicted HAD superfamily phosphohydrolase
LKQEYVEEKARQIEFQNETLEKEKVDTISRPKSQYQIFCKDKLDELKHLKPKEKFKKIGDMWSKISPEESKKYIQLADIEEEAYKVKLEELVGDIELTDEERHLLGEMDSEVMHPMEYETNSFDYM